MEAEAGEFLLVHADMELVLEAVERGHRPGLAAYFARLVERLARGGAEVAAISAVTPHMCIRELEEISVLPLVNIVAEVGNEIQSRGYQKIALFGTRYVVESRLFGMLPEVEVIVPDQVDEIHRAYMQIVHGEFKGKEVLSGIARGLHVDAVVLAGTDLSCAFDEANTDFVHVDCVRAHIRGIMRELRFTKTSKSLATDHTA